MKIFAAPRARPVIIYEGGGQKYAGGVISINKLPEGVLLISKTIWGVVSKIDLGLQLNLKTFASAWFISCMEIIWSQSPSPLDQMGTWIYSPIIRLAYMGKKCCNILGGVNIEFWLLDVRGAFNIYNILGKKKNTTDRPYT